MTERPEEHDAQDLDRRWNQFVRKDPDALWGLEDADIHDIVLSDDTQPPSTLFVQTLGAQLQQESASSGAPPKLSVVPLNPTPPATVPESAGYPTATGVSRWASLLLVACLVLVVVGAGWIRDRQSTQNDPTSVVAVAGSSPNAATPEDSSQTSEPAGASSLDPGNTRGLTGPAPVVPRSIAGALPIGINGMDLSGEAIVTEYGSVLSAYNPHTLTLLWSVELEYGVYSSPVIAGERVFIAFTAQRDGATEALLGIDEMIDNRLLAYSLADGSLLWSVDDAGAAPVAPIVVNGAVYSLGEADGRWAVYASDAVNGQALWVSPALSNQQTNGNNRPTVSPDIGAGLAYGSGLVAVNYRDAVHVFASGTGELAWEFISGEVAQGVYSGRYSAPVIAGNTLLISANRSGLPTEASGEPQDGFARVLALDLGTGEELWRHEFGTLWEVTGPSVEADSVVFMAWNRDSETYDLADVQLTVVDLDSGDERTTISLGSDGWVGPFQGSISSLFDSAPVLVDEIAYVTTGESDRGAEPTAILTAIDLSTESIVSQTQFDGFSVIPPETVDGRLLFTTQVEGLLLVDGDDPGTDGEVIVTDLRTINTCMVEPGVNPMDDPALANATPVGEYVTYDLPMSPDEVPAVRAANAPDEETVAPIVNRFASYQSCFRTDEQDRLYGFFSSGFYENLVATGNASLLTGKDGEPRAPYFASSGEVQTLQVDTLQLLDDGRVAGIVTGAHSPRYVIWVLEDSEWRIDEWHSIVDRSDEATPEN